LIKYSLQPPSLPKPLSPRVLDEHATALKELEELRYAVKGAETKLAATVKEYNDAKAAASSINKWSSGSKTASANAERLKKQMDLDLQLSNDMKKKLEAVQKSRQVVIDLVDTYRNCVAGYEDYKEMLVRHAKESEESEKEVSRALRKEHIRLSQVLPAPPRQQEPWQTAVAATALY
jgi:3-dehydroquinate synthase class II